MQYKKESEILKVIHHIMLLFLDMEEIQLNLPTQITDIYWKEETVIKKTQYTFLINKKEKLFKKFNKNLTFTKQM